MTLLEYRTQLEDKIQALIEPLTRAESLIAYRYLRFGKNCSMDSIDYETDKAVREEWEAQQQAPPAGYCP